AAVRQRRPDVDALFEADSGVDAVRARTAQLSVELSRVEPEADTRGDFLIDLDAIACGVDDACPRGLLIGQRADFIATLRVGRCPGLGHGAVAGMPRSEER